MWLTHGHPAPRLCLPLHLLPGLQTEMTKWPPEAPQLVISHALKFSLPVKSRSSPPPLPTVSHPVHLISLPVATIHRVAYVQSQESSSAPPSPSPSHPPSPISAPQHLWNLSTSLSLSVPLPTSTIPTAPLPRPPVWPLCLQPSPLPIHLHTAPG